ncbi:thioesterase, FlK family [Treponema putidum]|uniref:thioesterase, FlK family n=1 Tax=Treponema putidum TaxID=221027 RepID=UPI003D8C1C47
MGNVKVYCKSELTDIEWKKRIFSVKVYDKIGLIVEGTHERFIDNNEKFQKKQMKRYSNYCGENTFGYKKILESNCGTRCRKDTLLF